MLTNGTAGTRGVDGNDYIEVQLSTNGGVSYSSEIRVRGFSNAQWDYSATGVAAKTANGTLTTFTTPNGNNYALRPGGYSTVELTLPVGSTQCAVDIYNRVNSAGEDFWIDNIELIEFPNTPLPISLLSFRGISQQNQNLIEWTTASEQNNSHFILEQSTNGLFNETSVINMQHGGGNSSTPLHYSFTVKNPEPTINYYKLTQVDFDGAGKESFIISVNNRDTKYIVKSINTMGQEVNENYPGLVIHQYNDGTITKTYN